MNVNALSIENEFDRIEWRKKNKIRWDKEHMFEEMNRNGGKNGNKIKQKSHNQCKIVL